MRTRSDNFSNMLKVRTWEVTTLCKYDKFNLLLSFNFWEAASIDHIPIVFC